MNLAFKIANLAIFFIVATIEIIEIIVEKIIVSKILLSSRQCRNKPKSTGDLSDHTFVPDDSSGTKVSRTTTELCAPKNNLADNTDTVTLPLANLTCLSSNGNDDLESKSTYLVTKKGPADDSISIFRFSTIFSTAQIHVVAR